MHDVFRTNAEALANEFARRFSSLADKISPPKSRADVLAGQIKAALAEFGELVGDKQRRADSVIARRPGIALISAFAVGVAVGYCLRDQVK
ncbi:MAG TPA: hypothetical protein VNZ94_17380 [Xanthobacteraceae bacterium]|nr:hypothetical protein [Xanthobacteraceae bacterium]